MELTFSVALVILAVVGLWRSEAIDARYYRRRERYWFEQYLRLARLLREASDRGER